MERPEKVITKPSAVRPELGRRDTESPDMFPLCASAPLWPIIEPLLCRNRGLNRTTEACGSAPKQKTAPVLKCQVVQKWCRNGAVLPPCAVREPKLVHFRSGTGGGIRFPEDRGGVEATRRVKLNGAENENRYKNSTETFRNVRAGWFPIGEGAALPQQAPRNQNQSKTSPVSGGGGFLTGAEAGGLNPPVRWQSLHRRWTWATAAPQE